MKNKFLVAIPSVVRPKENYLFESITRLFETKVLASELDIFVHLGAPNKHQKIAQEKHLLYKDKLTKKSIVGLEGTNI